MNGVLGLLKSLGPGRLAAMGAVALGLVGFFAYIILRYSVVAEAPLYTGLSLEDSAAIVAELESAAVPFTIRENGSAIMVPEADVLRLRMTLAGQGLPAGGGVGYEIFDKSDTLGTTSFVQNVNHLRALEGELARTIRTIRSVENARVHLVLPERQLFRRDAQKPTASIVLKTRGALDPGQIRAIQHLAASAVPELEPSRISIVDETGRLLAEGNGDDALAFMASTLDERTNAFQRQVEDRLRDIVESVVGTGRARVKVAAELDFNRISETQDLFDPDGQVVRSTQSRDERSNSREAADQVTAGNQIPNGGATNPGDGAAEATESSEEVVNYEISKTTRTQVTEMGGVKRVSVAVLVDGRYQTGPDGVQTYMPRAQQELDQIAALVRSAMGFDQTRGDQIEVVNLQFADAPISEEPFTEPGLLEFGKDDIIRVAELGVMLVLTLLVLLFAVRPLVRSILSPGGSFGEPAFAGAAAGGQIGGGGVIGGGAIGGTGGAGTTVLIGSSGQHVEMGADGKAVPQEPSRIDEAKAHGAQQLDQIRRVGDLVAESPNEAAILIRTWLSEGS